MFLQNNSCLMLWERVVSDWMGVYGRVRAATFRITEFHLAGDIIHVAERSEEVAGERPEPGRDRHGVQDAPARRHDGPVAVALPSVKYPTTTPMWDSDGKATVVCQVDSIARPWPRNPCRGLHRRTECRSAHRFAGQQPIVPAIPARASNPGAMAIDSNRREKNSRTMQTDEWNRAIAGYLDRRLAVVVNGMKAVGASAVDDYPSRPLRAIVPKPQAAGATLVGASSQVPWVKRWASRWSWTTVRVPVARSASPPRLAPSRTATPC